jgi:copper chaperone CopZ
MSRLSCVLVVLGMLAGCGKSDLSTSETATPVAFNLSGAPTVQFNVPDMMCPESCAVKTKEILSEQPGAKEVVVDFDSKTATVAIEEGTFDADTAIAALVDYGFEHSTLKPAADKAKVDDRTSEPPTS